MLYIIIGIIGFGIAFAYDWLSLRRIQVVSQVAGLAAAALIIFATIMVCRAPSKLNVPFFATIIGGCLLIVSLSLFIYSLLIEIPFHRTYVKQVAGRKLVSTGTYALVRHPGVIWLALVFIAISLIYPSGTLFLAVIIWWFLDLIYATAQDTYFFPRMFIGYEEYKKQTPFLIPTKQSFYACLKTLKFPI